MKHELSIRGTDYCLYISMTDSNIYVSRYRLISIARNAEELRLVGSWQTNPTHPNAALISKLTIVQMIQKATEDASNRAIDRVLQHKTISRSKENQVSNIE